MDVRPDGPAAEAGVVDGSTVLRADGQGVPDISTFRQIFSTKKPGDTLTLEVRNDGKSSRATLRLLGKF